MNRNRIHKSKKEVIKHYKFEVRSFVHGLKEAVMKERRFVMRKKRVFLNSYKKFLTSAGVFASVWGSSIAAHAAMAEGSPGFVNKIDPVFRVPTPPVGNLIDSTMGWYWTFGLLSLTVIALFFAIRDAKRLKTLVPVTLACSGVLCVFPEVVVDVLGGAYWARPSDPNNVLFTFLGRDMTLLPVALWTGFNSVMCYVSFRMMVEKVKTKWIWGAFFLAGLADLIIEEPLQNFGGIFVYYGNPALVLFKGFPLSWTLPNSAGLIFAAALAYRYREVFTGWKSLAVFITTPLCFTAVSCAVEMPMYYVVNGNHSWLVTQLGGILTLLFAFGAMAVVIDTVMNRHPFRLNETERVLDQAAVMNRRSLRLNETELIPDQAAAKTNDMERNPSHA
jgi:hypothetical protein